MKKEILSAIGIIAGILFGTTLSLSAQEKLSLKQCREMALKYNKEMAAADRQTEAARLMSLSYKANFFPNFTANGTGIYSTADGSLGIPGGNLPVFMPNPTTGELVSSGFAYFPGLNLDYKVGTVYSGGIQMEQPLYMGGKIRAAYKMSLLGKEMAHLNEALTTSEDGQSLRPTSESQRNEESGREISRFIDGTVPEREKCPPTWHETSE